MAKARIVGLGTHESERCIFCGHESKIYIDLGDYELSPACNECVGAGIIGDMAEVPVSLHAIYYVDGLDNSASF